MTRNRGALLLLVLAVVAGTALRARLIAAKQTLNHDEAISYLSATGKQGLYRNQSQAVEPPFGTWVPAAEIKRYLHPDDPLCFGRIRRDLAETDIHPPLYFWLLHLWILAVGVHTWSGPALNTLLAAGGAVALFGLACSLMRDRLSAAVVAAIWIVSPAVIDTCFEARHYDLLALCGIGFTWAILRCADVQTPPRPVHLVLLALITQAGLLTHYHFGLLVAAGGLWLAVRMRRQPPLPHGRGSDRRRRLLAPAAAIVLGGLAFVATHPAFLGSVLRAREQTHGFDAGDLVPRLEAMLLTYSTFFISTASNAWLVHKYLLPLGVAALAIATLATSFLLCCRSAASAPSRSRLGSEIPAPSERTVVYFFLTMAGVNSVLYLAGVSPKHAMGAQYLALVWPFLAFWPILLLVRLRSLATPALLLLCVAATASGTVGVQRQVARANRFHDPQRLLAVAPTVVIDNVARGVLPCVTWHLDDSRLLLAAPQAWLLDHPERWTARLAPGAVYVSTISYCSTVAGQEHILRTLAMHHHVTPLDYGVFGVGRLHVLTPASAQACRPTELDEGL